MHEASTHVVAFSTSEEIRPVDDSVHHTLSSKRPHFRFLNGCLNNKLILIILWRTEEEEEEEEISHRQQGPLRGSSSPYGALSQRR